jgi:prevent-host-death family protein
MKHVPIKVAKDQLTQLTREAEAGEHIVITRNGRAVAELGPVRKRGGLDFEALRRWKKERGYELLAGPIPDDFDDPLPEDFLISQSL